MLLEPQQTRKRKINLKPHQLPLRKKKKPLTKRFGELRYIKEKASNININEALDLQKYWEKIPALVSDEKDQEDKEESVSSNEHKPDPFKNLLTLDDRDVSLVLKGNMLNDTVTQFFQSLFDGINDLQDPLLAQRLLFKVPSEINYLDSLFKVKIVLKNKFVIYYTRKKRRLKCMLCLCNNRKTTLTVAYTQSPLLIL